MTELDFQYLLQVDKYLQDRIFFTYFGRTCDYGINGVTQSIFVNFDESSERRVLSLASLADVRVCHEESQLTRK